MAPLLVNTAHWDLLRIKICCVEIATERQKGLQEAGKVLKWEGIEHVMYYNGLNSDECMRVIDEGRSSKLHQTLIVREGLRA